MDALKRWAIVGFLLLFAAGLPFKANGQEISVPAEISINLADDNQLRELYFQTFRRQVDTSMNESEAAKAYCKQLDDKTDHEPSHPFGLVPGYGGVCVNDKKTAEFVNNLCDSLGREVKEFNEDKQTAVCGAIVGQRPNV